MVETLIQDVNKFEGEIVTMEKLNNELENERKTNIQDSINEMGDELRAEIVTQKDATTNYFQDKIDQQQ